MYQGVLKAFVDCPSRQLRSGLGSAFTAESLRYLQQPFGGILPVIENDIFHSFTKVIGNRGVYRQLARVDIPISMPASMAW